MIKHAIKFTDKDAFLLAVNGIGVKGEIKGLLSEDGEPPYFSAYFIPTELLPSAFNLNTLDQFGGSLTRVEEIWYQGGRPTSDFMVFKKSKRGYIEIDSEESSTFAGDSANDWATGEMNYVIIFEDGGAKEFYLTATDTLASMQSDGENQEPKLLKTNKQVSKQMDILRRKYSASCQIYAVEQRDFEDRRTEIN